MKKIWFFFSILRSYSPLSFEKSTFGTHGFEILAQALRKYAQVVKCSGKFAKIANCNFIFYHKFCDLDNGKLTGLNDLCYMPCRSEVKGVKKEGNSQCFCSKAS